MILLKNKTAKTELKQKFCNFNFKNLQFIKIDV